jgi:hypothetical protein
MRRSRYQALRSALRDLYGAVLERPTRMDLTGQLSNPSDRLRELLAVHRVS